MRLLCALYYMILGQTTKESTAFFWSVYCKVRDGRRGLGQRFWSGVLHIIFRENGANVPVEAAIKECPCLPHGLQGIYISQGAEIGAGCTIFQQVTIGSNMLEGSKGYGAPVIGDHVFIGAGAKIIGNVHVGDNSRIGANCIVTCDVPANATVVMEHPRVIVHQDAHANEYKAYESH